MNQIFTFLLDLPHATRGLVQQNAEGDYLIFINSRYNTSQQREIFNREVRCLLLGHHCVEGQSIGQIECDAPDKQALLNRIKLVEKHGLPLTSSLLLGATRPEHSPPKRVPPAPLEREDDFLHYHLHQSMRLLRRVEAVLRHNARAAHHADALADAQDRYEDHLLGIQRLQNGPILPL